MLGMTKDELSKAEDDILFAVRKVYGYDDQANELVDMVCELVELAEDYCEEDHE